ncbi:E3 ubiquitin-protein ligase RSL1-like [Corylus avellana]|uniref:E3 ubiquitin-protein ligase RSL1-like n=1 Tax=Corylus avellana TaxID=13451 RepID=UPI00286C1AFA|nr:E3 ubiquitin-protein ligase RSL1-like [Corylus avellana]
MTAKSLDSDLDLAYHLQMQEAMTASLALQPSTSRCPSAAATVILRELNYRVLREPEIGKMREHLDRRLHNQKLANNIIINIPDEEWESDIINISDEEGENDIINIPDGEWEVTLHNYRRPYDSTDPSTSSSAALVETECFRLYFMGLVTEESVRDTKITVAGAGVAICDSRDSLIFEVRKNLNALVDVQTVTYEIAELEALIEGLNEALRLDLKRLTFFCDHYNVYQYVTGRAPPRHSKIATLVNQVALLRRKFTYCNPSLVACKDVKFAIKSANAIVSQTTYLKETCVICFEDTDADKMFSVDGCQHRYCFSCMKQHVEAKFLNGMMAKCPHEGCKSEVNIDSCGKFLAPKLVEVMSQRMKESSIPVTEKVYCPYPRCSALMSKSEILQYNKTINAAAEETGVRKCMKCHLLFCINCKIPWHSNLTCYDYKRSNPYSHSEYAKLQSLAEAKRWRQCVKCNNIVELAGGCYHITCRCGYEFCYTCGAEWKNKKATCSCRIWDEHYIIRGG